MDISSDDFITDHLPVVEEVVSHYRPKLPKSFLTEDLRGAGRLGLVIASRTYNPSLGPANFWARFNIRREVIKLVSERNWQWAQNGQPLPKVDPAAPGIPEESNDPKLARISAAVEKLPPLHRKLIEMLYEQGLSETEISGRETGKPLLGRKYRRYRVRRIRDEALQLLREELDKAA